MFYQSLLGAALVLVGVHAPSGEGKLVWKFKEGDKFYIESVTSIKQTTEFMGRKVNQDMETASVNRIQVLKVDGEKIVLEQTNESTKLKGESGLGSKAEMEKMLEKMKGVTFKITLDASGKISQVEGYAEMIKKLGGDDDKAVKSIKSFMPEETLKTSMALFFGFLPGKTVAKGDKWKQEMNVSLGPVGALKGDNEYTNLGAGKEGVEIGYKTTLTYAPPKETDKDFPFKVTKGTLNTEKTSGTIVFDPEKGRVIKSELMMLIKGSVTMEIMGAESEITLEQNTTNKTRVLDKAP